jgi:hypothetical protein
MTLPKRDCTIDLKRIQKAMSEPVETTGNEIRLRNRIPIAEACFQSHKDFSFAPALVRQNHLPK